MEGEKAPSFERVAEEYDRVRPGYPPGLVDAACVSAGVRAGSRVLEIGCGTGQLRRTPVERGLHVEAVDPGAELVGWAKPGCAPCRSTSRRRPRRRSRRLRTQSAYLVQPERRRHLEQGVAGLRRGQRRRRLPSPRPRCS